MTRYEYRSEPLALSRGRRSEEEILEALNRFGREGWRLNQILGTFGRISWKAAITLLLEREITDETRQ